MFARKCPCCNEKISITEFLKVSPNGSKYDEYDITCKSCDSLLISKKTFGLFMIVLWIIIFLQYFVLKAIENFTPKDDFYYYTLLLAVEMGVLMLISLLVLFHKIVSKNYICTNADSKENSVP